MLGLFQFWKWMDMIKAKPIKKVVTEFVVDSVTCDRCKKNVAIDKVVNNEYLKFHYEGGFWSDYPGDLNRIEFELCEECMQELFGGFARVVNLII